MHRVPEMTVVQNQTLYWEYTGMIMICSRKLKLRTIGDIPIPMEIKLELLTICREKGALP